MSHRRTLLVSLVLAGGIAACGGTPQVVLQAEPAGVPDAPASSDPTGSDGWSAVTSERREEQVPEEVPAPQPEPAEPVVVAEPAAPAAPAAPSSPAPTSSPSEPELIVGEDGCVTDVELGIVITCHDPAAGPD